MNLIKFCKKCQKEYPNTEEYWYFKNGKAHACRPCKVIYKANNKQKISDNKKRYWEENKEIIKPKKKESYYANHEKHLKFRSDYVDRNREEVNRKQNEEYKKDPQKKLDANRRSRQKYDKEYKAKRKEYYRLNIDEIKRKDKESRLRNKDKINANAKARREKNLERYREIAKKSRLKHIVRRRKEVVAYDKKRYQNDPEYKMVKNIRRRVLLGLKDADITKNKPTLELLQAESWPQVHQWIESKFEEGMSWSNHGAIKGNDKDKWHIDHKKPLASFNLSDPEQLKEAFHYQNLQPLWGPHNLSKGKKTNWVKPNGKK